MRLSIIDMAVVWIAVQDDSHAGSFKPSIVAYKTTWDQRASHPSQLGTAMIFVSTSSLPVCWYWHSICHGKVNFDLQIRVQFRMIDRYGQIGIAFIIPFFNKNDLLSRLVSNRKLETKTTSTANGTKVWTLIDNYNWFQVLNIFLNRHLSSKIQYHLKSHRPKNTLKLSPQCHGELATSPAPFFDSALARAQLANGERGDSAVCLAPRAVRFQFQHRASAVRKVWHKTTFFLSS